MTVLRLWIEFNEKSYVLNTSRIFQNIMQSLVAIILAWFSFGIVGQFCSLIIGHLLFSAVIYFLFKKMSTHSPSYQLSLEEKKDFYKLLIESHKSGIILSICSRYPDIHEWWGSSEHDV